jgi:hypothetical protein
MALGCRLNSVRCDRGENLEKEKKKDILKNLGITGLPHENSA